MKQHFCILIIILFCHLGVTAATYVVNANNGVNVRAEASSNSEILGKLNKDTSIEVKEIDGDWANIAWNNSDAYVHAKYLTPQADKQEKSWFSFNFNWKVWTWFLDSKGNWTWFTLIAVLFAIGIVAILAYLAINIFIAGVVGYVMTLGLCFILEWLGVISSSTMWAIPKWGFLVGCVGGIIALFKNPEGFLASNSGSSGNSVSPRTGLSPQINEYEGVRTSVCCGSCAYCSGNHDCTNTNCSSYLERVNPDNDGSMCSGYKCRY